MADDTSLAATPIFSRAQQRFLGLVSTLPRPDALAHPLQTIRLEPQAQRCLMAQFYAPGTFRSGPLFGRRHNGVVTVSTVMRGTPPGLVMDEDDLFPMDASYLLGCSDALRQAEPVLDWVGHWLIAPDNALGSFQSHLDWLGQARPTALADEDTFLMIIGGLDESIIFTSYVVRNGEPTVLPVTRLPDVPR